MDSTSNRTFSARSFANEDNNGTGDDQPTMMDLAQRIGRLELENEVPNVIFSLVLLLFCYFCRNDLHF